MNAGLGDVSNEAIRLLKERVSGVPRGFDGRALLLFSGGRDSSAVAAAFCQAFPQGQLHLLLIDNGLLSRLDNTRRQATLIQTLHPNTDVVFEVKRVSDIMRRAGMQRIERNFTQEGYSTLLICLACKMIMTVSAARYAREMGIRVIMDGYADRQHDYPEQTEEFMTIVRQFYAEAGYVYLSPLYDILSDKGKVNQMLGELGVYIPKQEPVCMFVDSFSTADPKQIVRYTQETLALIRELDPLLHP